MSLIALMLLTLVNHSVQNHFWDVLNLCFYLSDHRRRFFSRSLLTPFSFMKCQIQEMKLDFRPEAMVDQARESLCCQGGLMEKTACSDLTRLLHLGNCATTMFLTGSHRKWLCYFVPYGHGKLDLSFVHGRAEKCKELLHICKNGRNRRGK